MKILFCSPTRLDRTLGAPKVIIELAEGLTRLGCECDLIGPKDIMDGLIDGRHDPKRFAAALGEHLLKVAGDYHVVDYDHEYLPYDRSKFAATTLMVARSVLLHYHFSEIKIPQPMNLRAVIGRSIRNIKASAQDRENRRLADITGKQADLFLTLNSQDKTALVQAGYDASKVTVVGLGLHTERFAALAVPSLDVPTEPKVGFVGTFDYRKGCLDIPKIAAGVIAAVPSARFRLIGTHGLFKTADEVLAHFPAKLRANVEVIPRFKPDELPSLLDTCSAGIFPSYIEGFGFGVLEMLAAGLPVIAYDAPGPPDILPAHLLVPRGDIAGMSAAVVGLLKDSAKLAVERVAARETAKSFTWIKAAQQTLAAYQSAIASRVGKRAGQPRDEAVDSQELIRK
jgi:glycosyltransferase involved in cell wall biosynthesis